MNPVAKAFSALVMFCMAVVFLASCQQTSTTQNPLPLDSIPPDLQPITKRIQADPTQAGLYHERAVLFLERKDADKALADINQAIQLKPDEARFYITLSDVYLVKNMPKNCREALEKAISIDNQETEAYLKLAELSLYFRDYTRLDLYVDEALKTDPGNAKAWFIRGFALKEQGDTVQAVKAFQKAANLDQQYYDALIQLGMLFSAQKNRLAADYLKSALKLKPESFEAMYNLAMFYQESEEFNEAIALYNEIIRIDPANKYAYFNLGYIHMYYLKVFLEGVKYFSRAIEIDPAYAEAFYNRGYCYELAGDVIGARSDYQRALSLRANYNLAVEGLNRLDKLAKPAGR